jgi:hypothetical protein
MRLSYRRLLLYYISKYVGFGCRIRGFWSLFYGASTAPPVYFAVDALDECDQTIPGLEQLLQLISTSLLSYKVKWLVSSRPEVDVLAKLKDLDTHNLDTSETLVELDTQQLEGPVNAYIDYKLSALKRKAFYKEKILAEVSKEVCQRAMIMFLWVALVFKELHRVEGWDAVKTIKEIPEGLLKLYDHMMDRIENGSDPQHCKSVLMASTLAYCPLSLSELTDLAGLQPEIDLDIIVKKCSSFLTTRESIVYLIHQSAKDYLNKNYMSRLQPAGVAQGHADIGRRLIDAMSSKLKQNIYNLDYSFKSKDIRAPDPDPLAPIQYSYIF